MLRLILAEVWIVIFLHCSDSSLPKYLTVDFVLDVMMQLTWLLVSFACESDTPLFQDWSAPLMCNTHVIFFHKIVWIVLVWFMK